MSAKVSQLLPPLLLTFVRQDRASALETADKPLGDEGRSVGSSATELYAV